ncbi:MAG: MotA/TolQ/ExbB proton channel family protein [Bacteroidales bacterium]|nr:MotA/TolQ/ExbB proton channel family protein [Bacteroidales bacterium]MDD2824670.1 MotA/TolQ/ExbB proton channel family protein [Bacteroidales bacterium]MDD3101356.1 MotA/TolQ/ExbB proton channel family protein [Bacteroidales bacterium]MDD3640059.1 MotA/TolQ/ExbB proton channel family protein [Bacteroidales bacterium]MDD3945065.1 MotA/TolQ/ExbB proton channel family protein [Bacteroidales bacterium]
MLHLFIEGGPLFMGILTIELVFLLIAAWKAPAWVKEIGLMALITGILGTLIGMQQACDAIQRAGDISLGIMAGGMKVALITVVYGGLIYFASLIIRIIHKPRI